MPGVCPPICEIGSKQTASSKVSPQLYADAHQLEHGRKSKHRVHVVKVPDESAPLRNTPQIPPRRARMPYSAIWCAAATLPYLLVRWVDHSR